jgi:hypothetical protein
MSRIVRGPDTLWSENRQSDNGHVGFMRMSSRSSSDVTRTVDHGPMHERTLASDAATDVELFCNRSQLAVARTLPIPFAAAVAAVVGLTRPPCPIDRRWLRDHTGPFDRSDLASARAHGRLPTGRRDTPIEIELAPWADGVTELVIRPDVRAPQRWSGRRRRRWYASAHAAADALRQQIIAAQPAVLRPRRVREQPQKVPGQLVVRRRLAG